MFQVVILAGGAGNRMYPLTEGIAKSMLPVANRPLLAYQLDILERAGVEEVIIVTVARAEDSIRGYLAESYGGSLRFVFEVLKEHAGTCNALRAIRDKIKTDFFVISGDVVTNFEPHRMADVHRTQSAALTMLLKKKPVKDAKSRKKNAADETIDYVGLADIEGMGQERRLLYVASSADLEEELSLDKNRLYRHPNFEIAKNYLDGHLYIFAPWVMEVLESNPKFESIRGELVPYLVQHQFYCPHSSLPVALPEASLEPNIPTIANDLNAAYSNPHDRVRCIAYTLNADTQTIFMRANTVPSYLELNRFVLNSDDPSTPWAQAQRGIRRISHDAPPMVGAKSQIGSDCLVGEGVRVGERTSIKRSIVGPHCTIGSHVKLSNCIVMDHVTIEDGVTLSNCILCNSSFVKEKCSLTDCQVGVSYTVQSGTTERGAALCQEQIAL